MRYDCWYRDWAYLNSGRIASLTMAVIGSLSSQRMRPHAASEDQTWLRTSGDDASPCAFLPPREATTPHARLSPPAGRALSAVSVTALTIASDIGEVPLSTRKLVTQRFQMPARNHSWATIA